MGRIRELDVAELRAAVIRCIERTSFEMDGAELAELRRRRARESSCMGCAVLDQLLDNAEVARSDRRPLCQDTGLVVVRVTLGQDVHLVGGELEPAIHSAVAEAWSRCRLRPSVVRHPLARRNTGDNTPAVIHIRLAPGEQVELDVMEKGGGCENMSRLAMLTPADGREGVVDFVVRSVVESGGNACPPLVVGVGLGGSFERAAQLAKEALWRPFGAPAEDPLDRELEAELMERLNATGLGPMGLGGDTTALAVHVQSHPCHIASLPVAVNLDCHSHRHAREVL
ncbi:MAG: fumarate hydratase [Kiritimatiellae bacterium]|nr:fumarate hydratase [Kiritimatiellia bacterium]